MIPVHGPIAWLGVPTIDRRRLDALSVFDYRMPVPIVTPVSGSVGRLSIIEFRADGTVWARGEADESVMGAGLVSVGVDMESIHLAYDPPAPDEPNDWLAWQEQTEAVEVLTGSLLGVTINGNPAWPDAHLEVIRGA